MLLQELLDKRNSSSPPPAARRTSIGADDDEGEDGDARRLQVKAAVRPSEKPVFEALAERRNTTLSNLIRNYLLSESRREGLLI